MRLSFSVLLFTFGALFNTISKADTAPALPPRVEKALAQSGSNRSELLNAYELVPVKQHTALHFLLANMPTRDLESLSGSFLANHIKAAYQARQEMPWGHDLSEDLFLNYVLPYANLDERRDTWRGQLFDEFHTLVKDCRTPGEAAGALNTGLYKQTGVVYSKKRPKANQSPLESIEAQMASCTGLSILLVDACRSFAIPARIVGTPLWTDFSGNHTWVEVWDNGWHCMGAAESNKLDDGWFLGKAARQDATKPQHTIYAASFERTDLPFPLAWDRRVRYVSATNVTARYTSPQESVLSLTDVKAWLESDSLSSLLNHPQLATMQLKADEISAVRDLLWNKYLDEITHNEQRQAEVESQQVTYHDKTMRYVAQKIGEKPAKGWPLYIALHGGGNAPARLNGSQWQHMQIYYRDSIKAGIYLAARGVNKDWNLHWIDESFVCYDRIIENLIAFEGVDPDRIYLMGFSAGGDATYQIPARMPDRWAAAAMSAGHPNGVSPVNYAHVPFLIQVGALDTSYDRSKVAAQYGLKLDTLQREHPDAYRHDCYVHVDRHHNFPDNDPTGALEAVYVNPGQWLQQPDQAETHKIDTNSIHWLNQFTRNPLPQKVIWEYSTHAERSASKTPEFWPTSAKGQSCYWLSLDRYNGQTPLKAERLVAQCDPTSNSVTITEIGNHVKLLLHENLFYLSQPIRVTVEGTTIERQPTLRLRTMIRTLLDRGDPNYIFPAALWLTKNPENDWLLEAKGD